jgi:hypothetical protein
LPVRLSRSGCSFQFGRTAARRRTSHTPRQEHLLLPAACGSKFISLVGLGADGLLIERLELTRPSNHSIGR